MAADSKQYEDAYYQQAAKKNAIRIPLRELESRGINFLCPGEQQTSEARQLALSRAGHRGLKRITSTPSIH
ncbi:hypothetical protein [Escherichia coli]|uniref:hypothetical protein n=1 Tax=Escherichia coli TaxID=562 RepID=UPI0013014BFB|nr:hypothetical protein [Escherichia coli]